MASTQKKLKTYRARRDLKRSPEPYGGRKKHSKERIFVVQKHAASHLHYDFRLEIDGVLVSWAVPKGPSLNPSIKRLAVQTDDHPMEYADFEGIISQGSYGGGTVMVWDKGVFRNLKMKNGKEMPLSRCLQEGRIEVWLEGEKLQGGFALVKFARASDKDWLLIKMKDEHARRRVSWSSSDEKSVISGRAMRQIAREEADEKD